MTDTERHGPVPRRLAARPDRRTSYFDENQASQAKKPSKNDMPSPHRRIFCHCSRERPAPATAQRQPHGSDRAERLWLWDRAGPPR